MDSATGLRAVKMQRHDGVIEYAIWDAGTNVPILAHGFAQPLGRLHGDRHPDTTRL